MPHSPATSTTLSKNLWRLVLVLGVLALPLAAGCGKGGSGDRGTVSGKLTVKGSAPAANTTIKYTGADGKDSVTTVDGDGAYTVLDVAPGDAKITVTGSSLAVPVAGGGDTKGPGLSGAKGGVPIPPKYATAGAIPNFTVKAGKNENNINLD